MDVQIKGKGAFSSVLVQLDPGENFVSESGAMFRASSNIDIDVTTRSRSKGGILAGIKRMLAADSFFLSTYSVMDGQSGEVGLAPTLQGDVRNVSLDGSRSWVCSGGSYLASSSELELDTQFQGFKGFLGGESLFFLTVSGSGELLVSSFGKIHEVQVEDALVVDTGHLVAFEQGLDYRITKAGGSWLHSFLGGEGLVMHFSGQGRVLVQSHNPSEFGPSLGRLLPPRKQ